MHCTMKDLPLYIHTTFRQVHTLDLVAHLVLIASEVAGLLGPQSTLIHQVNKRAAEKLQLAYKFFRYQNKYIHTTTETIFFTSMLDFHTHFSRIGLRGSGEGAMGLEQGLSSNGRWYTI